MGQHPEVPDDAALFGLNHTGRADAWPLGSYNRLMSTAVPAPFTEAEYLALERASETKHEFVRGVITSMAGARPPHNILAARMTIALGRAIGARGCEVMTSDQRVHVPAKRMYAYPDVAVACGERRYDFEDPPSLLNPVLLVEITSKTTKDYDRGSKFLEYQSIDSFGEYLVVSHEEVRVDHHQRLETGQWLTTTYLGLEAEVHLASFEGVVLLADIYGGVNLEEGG